MYIEQLYTNCLAEAAYYIESDGEAAIIDPIRETEQYLAMAAARGTKIKYILETHFHADFISGHIDLATSTGAPIVYGPGAEADYTIHVAKDGERLRVGKLEIEVLHTPGHTPESVCYLLYDEQGKPNALFSGDTLFVGDVGRPDLLDGKMSKEALSGMMYDSLKTKIAPLPDDVIVYPAHGPGSACGKSIGKETFSTIGVQRLTNYALAGASGGQDRNAFIATLTGGLTAPPRYYFKDAAINKQGYAPLAQVMSQNAKPLSMEEFDRAMLQGILVLDARTADDFERGHVPGAINIGLDGNYAWWAGTLLDISTPVAIVAPIGKEGESVLRLARIGYESVAGYLAGGFETWQNAGREIETVRSIEPSDFPEYNALGQAVLDVRRPGEFELGHVDGAINIPLADLEERLGELDSEGQYLVHCAGGYRSMVAASILARHGFENLTNVRGGYAKMKAFIEPVLA